MCVCGPVEIRWAILSRSKGSKQSSKIVINILEGYTLLRWTGGESTVGGPKAATSTSSSNSTNNDPERGSPKAGVPKGGAPNVGPRRVGPKISLFFSLSVSWNFGGVIEGWDLQMCTFGVLGLSCEAPAAL